MSENGSDFAAFISYSHTDIPWAKWLHRALESYRVPRTADLASTPERLGRCFRDDEESKASADLGQLLLNALGRSRALVVICSPAAARSVWVNKEIVEFKRLHGSDRVFALIVAGTAHGVGDECLAPALKRRIRPVSPDDASPMEPLAVDVRRLGRRDALLKIIAALLEVAFDQLKRRDERRSRQRFVAAVSTIAATLSIVSMLGWSAWQSQRAAKKELTDRMVSSVRDALSDGRSDVAVQLLTELDRLAGGSDPTRRLHLLKSRTKVTSSWQSISRRRTGLTPSDFSEEA